MSEKRKLLIPEGGRCYTEEDMKMLREYHKKVRQALIDSLKDFEKRLDQFEQTCHGSPRLNSCSLERLLFQIHKTYEGPNAYEISELSQCIRGFLREAQR